MLLFETENYKVTGMTCPSCASKIEHILSKIDGVEDVIVNIKESTVQISYNNKLIIPETMNLILSEIGYGLIDEKKSKALESEEEIVNLELLKIQRELTWSIALSTPVLLISLFAIHIPFAEVFMFILTTIILFYLGKDFFINAWHQAIRGLSSMDTLVAIGTGSAWLLSSFNAFFPFILVHQEQNSLLYFGTASAIITLMLLGKYLETKAKSHSVDSINNLVGLLPKSAFIYREGVEVEVPIEQVMPGDFVIIQSGEKIPVDGHIVEGKGLVDESMITGESFPVEKKEGDCVIGSTVNKNGRFLVLAEKVGKSILLSQIIKLVIEAQDTRAPIQRRVDKISSVYVPVVLVTTFFTIMIWMIFGPETKTTYAFITAISILLIACPCALGLSTPTAILVGIGISAEHGIVIKGANNFETIHKISAIVLDKSGTITRGKPTVTDIILSNIYRNDEEDMLSIIHGIERKADHILANAIDDHLSLHKILPVDIDEFNVIPGKGIKAIYKDQKYIIGTPKWLIDEGVAIPDDLYLKINELSKHNKKLVLVGYNKKATVIIALRDNIKPSAYKAINDIKKSGIEIHLLSADHEQTAKMIALETGIDHYKGEVLPLDKLEYIKLLQNKGHIVAMIGDVLEDSPALAKSDISISIGNENDFSLESADITLIKGDLSKIVSVIKIAKHTVGTIRQNLFLAFMYNFVGIPLAAGILFPYNGFLINPMIAGAAMALSSVSVLTNSISLKRIKI